MDKLLKRNHKLDEFDLNSKIRESFFGIFSYSKYDKNYDIQANQDDDSFLQGDSKENKIQTFLLGTLKYLDEQIQNQTLNELLYTISSCFSHFTECSLPVFDIFFDKRQFNENYLLINSSIFYELTNNDTTFDIPDFHFFIEELLKETQKQIQNNENENLTLFDHSISPQFKNIIILNLLLSSNLTKEIFVSFLPYVMNNNMFSRNTKFDLLLKKLFDSGLIFIPDEIDEIQHELIEIMTNKEIQLNHNMNEKTLVFITSSVYFTRSKCKYEINGLNIDTILPFIAIVIVYVQKYETQIQIPENVLELILNGIKSLNQDSSDLLKQSIQIILKSFKSQFFSVEAIVNMILLLAQKLIKYEFIDNDELILSYLFDFSTLKVDFPPLIDFFFSNGQSVLKFVFDHIDKFDDLKLHKLNLNIFNRNDICSYIGHFEEQEFKKTIFVIENFCYNQPVFNSFNQFLLKVMNEKIQQKNWNDVLLIVKFIKKNDSTFDFSNILNKFKIDTFPINIKCFFIENAISSIENIDDLLSLILNDPFPEKNKQYFQILFNKMIENNEIRQSYLKYLICIRSNNFNLISGFLKKFVNEFLLYQDDFIEIVNQHFYFNKNINALYKIKSIGLNSSIFSDFGNSIVSKLFESIESNHNNFQAFVCLKNIANSFPFLFSPNIQNIQNVFNSILSSFDCFYLVFEENKIKEQLTTIKTSISSLSFLMAILQSSIIFDKFLDWLFANIINFTNSQVFVFILLLLVFLKFSNNSLLILTYILKYDFIDSIEILINRKFDAELFKSQYINTLCQLISEIYKSILKLEKYEIFQIEELMKIENPINFYYENICFEQPLTVDLQKIYLNRISTSIEAFIMDIDHPYEFSLSNKVSKSKKIDSNQIHIFIEKLSKNEVINQQKLPTFCEPYSMKMIRYLVMKPSYVYDWFLFGKVAKLVPQIISEINKTNDELNEMKNKLNDGKENEDFESFDISDFLSPLIEKLVKLIINHIIDSRYLFIFTKLFKSIDNNSYSLPLFIHFTTQFFNEFSIQSDGCDFLPSLKIIHHLIDFFKLISLTQNFKENLHSFFCQDLIKIALNPKWRKNSDFLIKSLYVVYDYKSEIMNHIIQLISFIILNDSENIFTIFKFIDQLKEKQKEVNHLILFKFDRETEEKVLNNIIINFYNKFPSLLMKQRRDVLCTLLMKNVNYFSKKIDKKKLKFLSNSFNFLAPKRNEFTKRDIELVSISELIKEKSPIFWNLYNEYKNIILKVIKSQTLKFAKFKFYFEFPELISFKIRSLYFRKKMKKRIKNNRRIVFEIDHKDILDSSFNAIHKINPSSLLNKISIQYKHEIGIDTGGILRDWFTKLTHAIFNPDCSLFSCSEKSKSYQPNINSNVNSNHLQYFKFAGMIIARALIEGICIDSHLTTSFYKQILHQEVNLSDLKDVDEELFNSLQSLIDNDVDSLCLTFTSSEDEFGTCKTVPLKENGDTIDVKNENKEEYIQLLTNYKLINSIQKQLNEFCTGFSSLISNHDIKIFTPNELDLLLCGLTKIDVDDFKNHTEFIHPYSAETHVVKLFFDVISKWNNEQLQMLLLFMTGSSRVPANGFKEFCEMSGQSLKIAPGGEKWLLPVARTCFNRLDLPSYETEEELNEKLLIAIKNCNTFEIR